MSALDKFVAFSTEHEVELLKVYKELRRHVHNEELEVIRKYAGDILAYRAFVCRCLATFNELLDMATEEHLPLKQSNTTELDRKAKVEAKVSPVRYWRNFCKGMVDTIDKRVSYAQSELSFEKEYANRIGAQHG